MNSITNDLLRRLEQTDWFCNCTKHLNSSVEIAPVNTWAAALDVCASQHSNDARLEGRNELTMFLFTNKDGLSLWNSRSAELKPLVTRLIRGKLEIATVKARVPNDAGKVFLDALEWDLLALCMAREYGEIVRTRYHELLEHWYLAGRFPCGWIGEVPDEMEDAFQTGKLAVL